MLSFLISLDLLFSILQYNPFKTDIFYWTVQFLRKVLSLAKSVGM